MERQRKSEARSAEVQHRALHVDQGQGMKGFQQHPELKENEASKGVQQIESMKAGPKEIKQNIEVKDSQDSDRLLKLEEQKFTESQKVKELNVFQKQVFRKSQEYTFDKNDELKAKKFQEVKDLAAEFQERHLIQGKEEADMRRCQELEFSESQKVQLNRTRQQLEHEANRQLRDEPLQDNPNNKEVERQREIIFQQRLDDE